MSWPPGQTILRGYIPVWTLPVQNQRFLYDSIVHTYFKGGTGENTLAYTVVVHAYNTWYPCTTYVHVYTQYVHVYTMYKHVLTDCLNRFSWTTQRWSTEWYPSALFCKRGWGWGQSLSRRLIGPDGKWSVIVKLYRRVCTLSIYIYLHSWMCMYHVHTNILNHEHVCTCHIHLYIFTVSYTHLTLPTKRIV